MNQGIPKQVLQPTSVEPFDRCGKRYACHEGLVRTQDEVVGGVFSWRRCAVLECLQNGETGSLKMAYTIIRLCMSKSRTDYER
jgi:hypothetical protein